MRLLLELVLLIQKDNQVQCLGQEIHNKSFLMK